MQKGLSHSSNPQEWWMKLPIIVFCIISGAFGEEQAGDSKKTDQHRGSPTWVSRLIMLVTFHGLVYIAICCCKRKKTKTDPDQAEELHDVLVQADNSRREDCGESNLDNMGFPVEQIPLLDVHKSAQHKATPRIDPNEQQKTEQDTDDMGFPFEKNAQPEDMSRYDPIQPLETEDNTGLDDIALSNKQLPSPSADVQESGAQPGAIQSSDTFLQMETEHSTVVNDLPPGQEVPQQRNKETEFFARQRKTSQEENATNPEDLYISPTEIGFPMVIVKIPEDLSTDPSTDSESFSPNTITDRNECEDLTSEKLQKSDTDLTDEVNLSEVIVEMQVDFETNSNSTSKRPFEGSEPEENLPSSKQQKRDPDFENAILPPKDIKEILEELPTDILEDIEKIGTESVIKSGLDADLNLHFLKNVMALNPTARSCNFYQTDCLMDSCDNSSDSPDPVNPLDILCDILKDSSNVKQISQQKIVTKMAMCQFAVPLLLPHGDKCTLMMWTMRDIVKRWRPQSLVDSKGFEEDNLINISMPFCSFVRLGECSLSKSKLLNRVLSPSSDIHNFFVHRDMDGGNIVKRSSDGLVELSWYFPLGQESIDVFSDPIAVTNLRGDLEAHNQQLQFLLSISTALFIFVETISEEQFKMLSTLPTGDVQYFFIINTKSIKPDKEMMEHLNKLRTILNLNKLNFIAKNKNVNDSQLVKKLHSTIKYLLRDDKETEPKAKTLNLMEIANMVTENKSSILVDEKSITECQVSRERATEIINNIKEMTVAQYKKETMKLQGDLWRQLTKAEKELCRMRDLDDKDPEEYKSQLQKEIHDIRKQQSNHQMPKSLKMFKKAMTGLPFIEKQLFIKWLNILLEEGGRSQLSLLQAEYREHCRDISINANALKDLDQRLADSSLGIEHFIRELGQFYETAKMMKDKREPVDELPRVASSLLLAGFPLELIDGDASNIPLQWITDVLKDLDRRTGGNCRLRVITVLGVQSTGKSTLLNTMFGLQFPVASGRCTRGAFMTLLKVSKDFQGELGCHFILVIDTEGLKSLELASLDGSYEHDNELATVVVGLSDITIVNMAMENTEEMKDVLQIVVHAFLRMKEVGKKPSCQFVHQNVSDVSAHYKNRRARQKFLEQLNELTKVAARMEKKSDKSSFSEIIYCDTEKDTWYIPGLWQGIPPMASVNIGYSENVQELKQSIIKSLQSMSRKSQNIKEFTEWIRSLWTAVKHEKFIFSFRNQLVTEAYNQLCIEYSDWEWNFQKNIHHWMIKMEAYIYNVPYDKPGEASWNSIKDEMHHLLDREQKIMSQALEDYFNRDYGNVHLLDIFKGDFLRSVNYLRKELENTLLSRCERAMRVQKEKCEIQAMQNRYINIIEEKVSEIMEVKRRNGSSMNPEQLRTEFEAMWENTLTKLQLSKLEKQNVEQILIQQLKHDMNGHEQASEIVCNLTSLSEYRKDFLANKTPLFENSKQEIECLKQLSSFLTQQCQHYVSECISTKEDFNKMMSLELIKRINNALNSQNIKGCNITKTFELDLKLHILGNAAPHFEKMHNDFVQNNDPRSCLESLKPEYFSTFENLFEKRNECQRRAIQFCELCLRPAIVEHVNRCLGNEIVEDILKKGGPWKFKSLNFFQSSLLEELLQSESYVGYVNYINDYKIFVEKWISQFILEHYNQINHLQTLQGSILTSLSLKIKQALRQLNTAHSSDVLTLLAEFCNILKTELVISQNNLKVVAFQSNMDIKQFISDIETYLPDLENELCTKMKSLDVSSVLSQLNWKPQEELVKKVIGCGKQCPFCKAPCEAGGADHKEHFASIHRPRGLAQHKDEQTKILDHSICSTNVLSNKSFSNADTDWNPHPYKDYQKIYPDWIIYPETTADASDYWKYVFQKFNDSFAGRYNARPGELPKDWCRITKDQALKSLNTALNTKEKKMYIQS
ncbi:interferon-induced very large GTPase 1-like isoform X3 [Hyperolius riggenbachi]|uniref:interferon-induced very large GTPase 1-like isoform X3 n=1 Tax=Hyperolius riggenbachi TaxID=752182 RepID=UPI0035A3A863